MHELTMPNGQARKCLVTGGAGFIGSHLVERLLGEGHQVVVIDNFVVGGEHNVSHLRGNSQLQIIQADIVDADAIGAHFGGVDCVFHLAALADIIPSIENPMAYHRTNVDGTVNVLEAARKAGVNRFIYAASSSCYGIPDTYPTPETAPARPMYPYALTKYLGEQYVMHWGQTYGMQTVSLRMFNVYGPRHRTSGTYGAVFGVFLAQKLAGEPFTVVGDGTQTRDFTFVTDVCAAFIAAARGSVSQAILNIGSGNTYSVNRLVELLGGEAVHVPKRPGEPDCTFADITRIQAELDWQPEVKFEDGVAVMLENIDFWKEAPVWTPSTVAAATESWFKFLGGDEGR